MTENATQPPAWTTGEQSGLVANSPFEPAKHDGTVAQAELPSLDAEANSPDVTPQQVAPPQQPTYEQQQQPEPDSQYGYFPDSQQGFTPPMGAPTPGYGPAPMNPPMAPHQHQPQQHQPQGFAPQGPPPQGYGQLSAPGVGGPRPGWRQTLRTKFVSFGGTRKKEEIAQLVGRVRQPVRNDFRIAVLSLKGGVGKTTVTVGLGSVLASLRGDRVIAVDANPDLGTLARRIPAQTASTVRDLLQDPHLERYMDVRKHTSQALSRLEVLASERDPAISEAFNEDEYLRVIEILENHYNMILTDCGTGLVHSAMSGVMKMATSLVLVTSPALDGAQSAVATLDWLVAHGYEQLASQTVVVIAASKSKNSPVDINMMREYFLGRTRAVQIIPYDEHLAVGGFIDLDDMQPATRASFLELAATLVEPFVVQLPPPTFAGPFGGMMPQQMQPHLPPQMPQQMPPQGPQM